MSPLYFSIDQESVCPLLRLLERSATKEFYQCRSLERHF
jgi:hypothetical protein